MRIRKKLERILLRNVQRTVPKILLIPRPVQSFGRELVADMLEGITGSGSHLRIAWRIERLQQAGIVVVIGSDKIELVRRRITHDRRKKVVGQSELLGPVPERAYPGGGVVIMAHGNIAVIKREFVHSAVVINPQEVITGMRQVGG